MGDACSINVL